MRLTRRTLIKRACITGIGAAAITSVAGLKWNNASASTKNPPLEIAPITIDMRSLGALKASEPQRTRFGAFNFRKGYTLKATHDAFGGFSGLWRSPQGGEELLAVSDQGWWLNARVMQSNEGIISGLSQARIAPILSAKGTPLTQTRSYDTEGLCVHNGVAYVSVERVHSVVSFEWAKEGVLAKARNVPLPPDVKKLPANKSLEAIGMAPLNSALKGSLIIVAERSSGAQDQKSKPTKGWILSGPLKGSFQIMRRDDYDITDLGFLPNGDMLILERHFSLLRGVGMRVRRIRLADIRPDALLDGEQVLNLEGGYAIDNMEGMSIHQDIDGRTIITFISDDNFSFFQSTIIWETEWLG